MAAQGKIERPAQDKIKTDLRDAAPPANAGLVGARLRLRVDGRRLTVRDADWLAPRQVLADQA